MCQAKYWNPFHGGSDKNRKGLKNELLHLPRFTRYSICPGYEERNKGSKTKKGTGYQADEDISKVKWPRNCKQFRK